MQQARKDVFKLIATQTAIIMAVVLFCSLYSWKTAYSLFLGGFVCVLPSVYFAHALFHYVGARMAKQAIRAFYFSEMMKLFMIAILSIIIFKYIAINALTFFFGFLLAQLAFWIAPACVFWCHPRVVRSVI